MKNILKKCKKKHIIILGIIIIWILLIHQVVCIGIDIYNFRQLEKARIVLDELPEDEKKFYILKQFNERYDQNISPVINCYYINNDNGKYTYIFGFKIYSIAYKMFYWTSSYAFPWYDQGYWNFCDGECYDRNEWQFNFTISHSCATSYKMYWE